MNQILIKPQKHYLKYLYFAVLILSVFIIVYALVYMFVIDGIKKDGINIAKKIAQSYSISKLYASSDFDHSNIDAPYVIGILSIPSIDLYLPVMSEINDDLLKVALCRFYGPKEHIPRQYMYCRS